MKKTEIKAALKAMHLDGPAKGLYKDVQRLQRDAQRLRRGILGVDKRITKRYLAQEKVKKLHLGCGSNVLGGWLNSDLFPESNQIIYLDVTKNFPFPDGTFDYIFSEHMIEHLSYMRGQHMLSECFRVLRNSGTIRISTPDLLFLVSLYRHDKSELQGKYINWSMDRLEGLAIPLENISSDTFVQDTFVINNFVRDWGHTFIYDEKVLRHSLERAGFTHITRCDLNQSDDHLLRDLENEGRMPEGFLWLESFTLEGKKLPID